MEKRNQENSEDLNQSPRKMGSFLETGKAEGRSGGRARVENDGKVFIHAIFQFPTE